MGRPPQIDRARILAASLALADQRGLAAVTMQGVAAQLGVTAMALYRHVSGKDALLDGLVEQLLSEVPAAAPAQAWDDQLAAMGHALRAIARAHPAAFPLLLQRPAVTAGAQQVRERVYAALRAGGVARRHVVRVERIVSTLAIGFAASEAAGRFPDRRAALAAEYRALVTFIRAGVAPFQAPRRPPTTARPPGTDTGARERAARPEISSRGTSRTRTARAGAARGSAARRRSR